MSNLNKYRRLLNQQSTVADLAQAVGELIVLADSQRAQLSEAQARLAEIEAQEPIGIVADVCGEYVMQWASFASVSGGMAVYAAPVAPAAHAAVKQSLTTDERTAAEETYTRRAFDYEQNPIGSRDWTLFWSGWCARAVQSLATIPNSHQPAAQVAQGVPDDVVRDARLGNRLYVWDDENPEDGTWDNIEEYLNDTTPNAGETVRLNLAMPLQDVEIEMIEVGKYGEPIRWEVRDAKTGALLAAQQQKEGEP